MPSFFEEVKASWPRTLPLPAELVETLVWLEANGHVHAYTSGKRYSRVLPEPFGGRSSSQIAFLAVERMFPPAWGAKAAPGETDRLALFLRTGGDGSHAGLWRDDDGRLRPVHLGSGSGSTLGGAIGEDVVDLLRLAAIGYEELCWPDEFDRAPREMFDERDHFAADEAFVDPSEYRAFVERAFVVKIPRRASEIVRAPASFDRPNGDAFLAWLDRMWR